MSKGERSKVKDPQDVAAIGFSNNVVTSMVDPQLTTIR